MPETDDIQLLRKFAERQSETAFGEVVRRHVNLVHSVALRQTGNPHAAEEITQAVFIILARKAGSLGHKTILSGWLYQTARLTAANFLRTERRRAFREQEAYMQSLSNESEPDVWPQIAPLLDDALGKLGEKDRHAIVLRFFEGKSLGEVGATLGTSEDAVKMRVNRALEKLRKIFTKRGVTLTATLIAGAVSANSVQAAPPGLVVAVTAVVGKGAAVTGSTLALVKGALKFMAWMKVKTAIAVGAAGILAVGTTTVMVEKAITRTTGSQAQPLEDGSLLALDRVLFGAANEFIHGSGMEKMLGNVIPSNGVQLLHFKLGRPTRMLVSRDPQGRKELAVAFKLAGPNATNHPLMKPAFFGQFRCVISGESGIEYVQGFLSSAFQQYPDGYFGYILASSFPRDSRWLWFRVEKREAENRGGLWRAVAKFKTENPARPANRAWVASPSPITNTVEGMDFVLGEITVETRTNVPNNIWNHIVTVPLEVRSNGVTLTNWTAAYVRAEDASGNWEYRLDPDSHRSLDPGYVWKLEADFEPESDFLPESLATVDLSGQSSSLTTNILNVPVKISWDGYWVDVNMPTNRPDLALHFICVTDEKGNRSVEPSSGSWNRHFFRKGSFMFRDGDALTMVGTPTTMTFAVVPNVHAIFYAQPRLVEKHVK